MEITQCLQLRSVSGDRQFSQMLVQDLTFPHSIDWYALQARLAQLVMVVQFGIIGIMIFGDKVFPAIGMQPPDMYEQVRDKKFAVGQSYIIKCALCIATKPYTVPDCQMLWLHCLANMFSAFASLLCIGWRCWTRTGPSLYANVHGLLYSLRRHYPCRYCILV